MDSGRALSLLDNMLWTSLIVAGPILLAILIIGLLISIFQVTTQLQEMTLSYVPKMLVTAGLLILLGPWMLARLTQFAISLYSDIPSIAGM
jgi:flagellar biosynthetic protein FliQ